MLIRVLAFVWSLTIFALCSKVMHDTTPAVSKDADNVANVMFFVFMAAVWLGGLGAIALMKYLSGGKQVVQQGALYSPTLAAAPSTPRPLQTCQSCARGEIRSTSRTVPGAARRFPGRSYDVRPAELPQAAPVNVSRCPQCDASPREPRDAREGNVTAAVTRAAHAATCGGHVATPQRASSARTGASAAQRSLEALVIAASKLGEVGLGLHVSGVDLVEVALRRPRSRRSDAPPGRRSAAPRRGGPHQQRASR